MPSAVAYCTVTGPLAAWESLTVKVSVVVPALPSVTDASSTEIVGSVLPAPLRTMPLAVVPLVPVVAWNPKVACAPAATSPFQAALRIT